MGLVGGGGGGEREREREVERGGGGEEGRRGVYRVTGRGDAGDCSFKTGGKIRV